MSLHIKRIYLDWFDWSRNTTRDPAFHAYILEKKGRRQRGACWRKINLAILDCTHQHKHGSLDPDLLHAILQWAPKPQGWKVSLRSQPYLTWSDLIWPQGPLNHAAVSALQTWGADDPTHTLTHTHSSSRLGDTPLFDKIVKGCKTKAKP